MTPKPLAALGDLVRGAGLALGADSYLLLAPPESFPRWDLPGVGGAPSSSVPLPALPFGDEAFDVVVLAAPLVAGADGEFYAVAREALRVARLAIIHAEGAEDHAQSRAAWSQVTPWPQVTWPAQGVGGLLMVRKPGGVDGPSEALAAALDSERTAAALLRAEVNDLSRNLDDARNAIHQLLQSPAARVANVVTRNKVVGKATAMAMRTVNGVRTGLRTRGLVWPRSYADEPASLPDEDDTSFGGLAARGRPNDPDAFLEAQPRVVAMCHAHWRGIRAATFGQTEHVLEVTGFKTTSQARRLAGFLRDCGTERVVMNGFPPGTHLFAQAMKAVAPQVRFFVVYHGTPALSYGEDVVLEHMVDLHQQGAVHKLGFVKHGLAEYFRSRGCKAEYVMNVCRLPERRPAPLTDGRARIGVFAPTASHKNVETQLLAALMVPGSEVHTIERVKARYLQSEHHRLIAHGMKPRDEFLELLGTMHAATYVSLVECYPMTVLESILCGTVCLTSNTSVLFQDDPVLQDALVVAHHDSPAAITRKLSAAIERREELVPHAQRHLERLNVRAEQRWAEFIDD